MKQFLETTIQEAGQLALQWFRQRQTMAIHQKGFKDLVTEADIAVENFIKQRLHEHFPEFGFWGEEGGEQQNQGNRWIVDPIDGTISFARGHHYWSVSIAVEMDSQIQLGMVYAPALELLYSAEKGKGAFCNGESIRVSSVDQMDQMVAATGFACVRSKIEPNNLPRYNRMVQAMLAVRVQGSAALDLCRVADGSLDAFFEQNLNLYDVGAGSLILQEAGGHISDFQGNPLLDAQAIFASNGKIHPQLLALA